MTIPTLVAYGAKSPAALQKGARALAQVLPDAELRELKGQTHNVSMKALAPILVDFFAGHRSSPARWREPARAA